MAIVQRTPPTSGQQTISRALALRLPRALSPLGGAPATGAPLPIYNIELSQTHLTDPVNAARLVGWRYPVLGGTEPGLAHLSTERDGSTEYEGLTRGYLPRRLIDAAQVAQEALGSGGEQYEARLLQVPALRIIALWMAGNDNRFVVLTDGQTSQAESTPPLIDDLRPIIEAARWSGAPPNHPAGAGPSNAGD